MTLDLLISQRSVSAFAEEKCVCRGKERLPRKSAFAEKGDAFAKERASFESKCAQRARQADEQSC